MTTACDLADRWLPVLRIELTVYVDNAAALALYAKFGFAREGLLRRYALRDGGYVDAYAMARLRPETEAVLPGAGTRSGHDAQL
jgi:putative acetyltransferase